MLHKVIELNDIDVINVSGGECSYVVQCDVMTIRGDFGCRFMLICD